MIGLPKVAYAILLGMAAIALLFFWQFALAIIFAAAPILVLLMLWDVMSGLNKIWQKLWEMDERLKTMGSTDPVS